MSSSKASAKHYIVPQDFFYCIDFFAQPKNRQRTSSTNYVPPKLKLTMDLILSLEEERRSDQLVRRWLDALPNRVSRVPGDSKLKVKAAQLEQLEQERDVTYRMLLAQQPQPQSSNMERMPIVKVGVQEYLDLIEPDRQRLFEHWASEAKELKEQRNKKNTKEQRNVLPARNIERSENGPRSKEYAQTEELYVADADLPSVEDTPPPIPPRSMLRPRKATSSEITPETTHGELFQASSSQYSSVVELPQKETTNGGTNGGTSGGVGDPEMGIRRGNPGLIAELRRGMERRRRREGEKGEELERDREQEISKSKVWALKLWQ
ncbi:hypothetical protein V493_02252 [Pseudogymnoascus sp. VKM F-4281 (FW-2241)]|nr:hypothetical protein V493_02252 [Pseudogymnoascus sp. VKM F-4281 (FW-2241)]